MMFDTQHQPWLQTSARGSSSLQLNLPLHPLPDPARLGTCHLSKRSICSPSVCLFALIWSVAFPLLLNNQDMRVFCSG